MLLGALLVSASTVLFHTAAGRSRLLVQIGLFALAVVTGFSTLAAFQGMSFLGMVLVGGLTYAWHAARTNAYDNTALFQAPLFYSGLCYLVILNGFAASGALGGMLFVTGLYAAGYLGMKLMVRAYE